MSIKQRIKNWLFSDDNEITIDEGPRIREADFDEERAIRFSVTPARGGMILSIRNYDPRTDRHSFTNHVIHDDQNVAESIAQIVSMELLRAN